MPPGKTDHTIDGGDMVEHIVELVERKAAALEAEQRGQLAESVADRPSASGE